jgi:hypothetical protein
MNVGENGDGVSFEVFMVVITKVVGYWVVTPRSFVGTY